MPRPGICTATKSDGNESPHFPFNWRSFAAKQRQEDRLSFCKNWEQLEYQKSGFGLTAAFRIWTILWRAAKCIRRHLLRQQAYEARMSQNPDNEILYHSLCRHCPTHQFFQGGAAMATWPGRCRRCAMCD